MTEEQIAATKQILDPHGYTVVHASNNGIIIYSLGHDIVSLDYRRGDDCIAIHTCSDYWNLGQFQRESAEAIALMNALRLAGVPIER